MKPNKLKFFNFFYLFRLLTEKGFVTVTSENMKVGDIVEINSN